MLLRTDMATKAETNKSRFVSLIDYVCINPLHDEDETHERMFLAWATSTRPRHTTKEEALQCTVSLVDYVCSNPLHEESETHERMCLRTDMGRCRVQHESLCGCRSVFLMSLRRRMESCALVSFCLLIYLHVLTHCSHNACVPLFFQHIMFLI